MRTLIESASAVKCVDISVDQINIRELGFDFLDCFQHTRRVTVSTVNCKDIYIFPDQFFGALEKIAGCAYGRAHHG